MKRKWIMAAVGFILSVSAVLLVGGVKLYRYEQAQQDKISSLEAKVAVLTDRVGAKEIHWNPDAYNYLAIGNSITLHQHADYWWNVNGMAATTKETDYVHLVESYLTEHYGNVQMHPYNFSAWEIQHTDRAQVVDLLDAYLSDELDLVTIQLGENAKEISDWESDFTYLIRYIQEAAPDAQVLVIGDFWEYENRDELKKAAAESCGVAYISLEEIKGNQEYTAGMGTVVYGDDGVEHIIEHSGVANHPGDRGMACIAKKITEAVK